MLFHAYPLKLFKEWVCNSMLSVIVGPANDFFSSITAKEAANSLPSIHMDVIDISSSDSEDETGVRQESHAESLNDAVIGTEKFEANNHVPSSTFVPSGPSDRDNTSTNPLLTSMQLPEISDVNLGNRVLNNGTDMTSSTGFTEGLSFVPQAEEHGEAVSVRESALYDVDANICRNDANPLPQNAQKRALPSSLLQNDSSTTSPSSLQSSGTTFLLPHIKTHVHMGPPRSMEHVPGENTGKNLETNGQQEDWTTFRPKYQEDKYSTFKPNLNQKPNSQEEDTPKLKPNQHENSCAPSLSNKIPLEQHTSKRTLPPSIKPTVFSTVSQFSKKESAEQFHDLHGRSNGATGAKTSDNVYMKGDSDSSDDEIIMYDTYDPPRNLPSQYGGTNASTSRSSGPTDNGNHSRATWTNIGLPVNRDNKEAGRHRFLPSWMSVKSFSEKYPSSSQVVDLSDGREQSRVGEQGLTEHDERLIFEAALQDLAQPKIEVDLPSGLLSVPLLRHQKIALAWLDQKETSSLPCSGGILADDQGLGKTVSMIALIQKQMPLQKKFMSNKSGHVTSETLNLDEDDSTIAEVGETKSVGEDDNQKSEQSMRMTMPATFKGRPAAGTLVICPASVLRQWAHELDEKVADSAKLSVLIYHGGTRTKKPADLTKYDVVLTTYAIVTIEVPKKPLAGDDDGERRNSEEYGLSSDFSTDKKRKAVSSAGNKKKKKKGKTSLLDDDSDSGPLARVRWFRVILDEAQVIKNHRTQVARACCGLRATRRWCLSGTPLQNAIDDMYSYFRFLKYYPYAVYASFCSTLKYPIIRNSETGYKKLQAVLRTVMLRRTKGTIINGKPILKLPPKSITLKKLTFSLEERSFYTGLEAGFRERFKRYAAEGTVKQNYANILLMLLRLRQACDHPLLVKDFDSDSSGKTSLETAKKLPKEKLTSLLHHLETSSPICGLCNDPPEDAVVTICGHVFCYQCISENLTSDDNLCPASGCRSMLDDDSIFSKGTLKSCIPSVPQNNATSSSLIAEESALWQNGYTSSKITAVLEILISLRNSYNLCPEIGSEGLGAMVPNEICNSVSEISYLDSGKHAPSNLQRKLPSKAIVFSQWTGMLDLLEISLNQSLIQYRRLDGSMSLASRDQAVKDFNTDPEVTVIIMSLKAGNLGLNMIAACHVILLDLWWNPTSEDQAIDRAHRIGQTKSVTVYRLTIEDTVEERILRLQEKKRDMVSSAFGEDQSGKTATRLTVEDLRYLFQV